MRVVLKMRLPYSPQSSCPPESVWARYDGASALSFGERGRLRRHCLRCEVCEARRNSLDDSTASGRALEWASTRIAAGLVAMVLLAGATRLESVGRFRNYEFAAFAPVPLPIPAVHTEEAVADDEGDATEAAAVPRVTRASQSQVMSWTDFFRPIGPYRLFVPPRRKTVTPEPARIDAPPPVIQVARLEAPKVPIGVPNLQPPRKHPLRRFVSVLAVPFRHL